jgi:hypothetical protein
MGVWQNRKTKAVDSDCGSSFSLETTACANLVSTHFLLWDASRECFSGAFRGSFAPPRNQIMDCEV